MRTDGGDENFTIQFAPSEGEKITCLDRRMPMEAGNPVERREACMQGRAQPEASQEIQ